MTKVVDSRLKDAHLCYIANMSIERRVKLFRYGKSQAIRIPREFELPGDSAIMRKVGTKIIIEPSRNKKTDILTWLKTLKPIDEDFPEIIDLPPDPVDF